MGQQSGGEDGDLLLLGDAIAAREQGEESLLIVIDGAGTAEVHELGKGLLRVGGRRRLLMSSTNSAQDGLSWFFSKR
jgi:hypothetical protein